MSYKIGDHLKTPLLGVFTHHGIYVGGGFVIEKTRNGVLHSTLETFSEGSEIEVVGHRVRAYSREESVIRAFSRLGDTKYNVVFDNCEGFVNWCINGLQYSEQVIEVATGTFNAYKAMGAAYGRMINNKLPRALIKYLKSNPDFVRVIFPSVHESPAVATILRTFFMKVGLKDAELIVGSAARALFASGGSGLVAGQATLCGIAAASSGAAAHAGISGSAIAGLAAGGQRQQLAQPRLQEDQLLQDLLQQVLQQLSLPRLWQSERSPQVSATG